MCQSQHTFGNPSTGQKRRDILAGTAQYQVHVNCPQFSIYRELVDHRQDVVHGQLVLVPLHVIHGDEEGHIRAVFQIILVGPQLLHDQFGRLQIVVQEVQGANVQQSFDRIVEIDAMTKGKGKKILSS